MNARRIETVVFIMAPVLSGVLLVLAFPTYNQWWLAWVALVPLLIAIVGRSLRFAFLLSWVSGIVFFSGTFYWIFDVQGYRLFHHAILASYMGLYFAFFGLAFNFISYRLGPTCALFAAPFVWISLEYIRANLSFLALPWALIAFSQHPVPLAIQTASITGSYGIGFLIVLVNAAITATILAFVFQPQQNKHSAPNPPRPKGALVMVIVSISLSGLNLMYGWSTLSEPISGEPVKTSLLQGNIEQSKKWDRKYAGFIMDTYLELSKEASKDRPAMIIWPEAATPGFILKNLQFFNQTVQRIRESDAYFLIGSSEYPKFGNQPLERHRYGNTALFFSPKGKVLGQYLKIRSVPFVESVPYEGTIPWPDYIVPEEKRSYEIQGKEFTLFAVDGTKFGVLICWESIFPELVRNFVRSGAQFMVNLVNEAWFGKTAAPYQFLSMCVFRAVENQIFIIRCANTGVSCLIDPYGRVVKRLQDAEGNDLFVQGILTGTVIPMKSTTIYTQYGDWFVWLVLLCSACFLMIAILWKHFRKHLQDGSAL